jgi:hypothetical protein
LTTGIPGSGIAVGPRRWTRDHGETMIEPMSDTVTLDFADERLRA